MEDNLGKSCFPPPPNSEEMVNDKKNDERKQKQRVEISKGADTLLNNRRRILDLNKVSLKMETGLLFRQDPHIEILRQTFFFNSCKYLEEISCWLQTLHFTTLNGSKQWNIAYQAVRVYIQPSCQKDFLKHAKTHPE